MMSVTGYTDWFGLPSIPERAVSEPPTFDKYADSQGSDSEGSSKSAPGRTRRGRNARRGRRSGAATRKEREAERAMRAALAEQDEEERAAVAALSQPEDHRGVAALTELFLMVAPFCAKEMRAKTLEDSSKIKGRKCPERTKHLAWKRYLEASTPEENEAAHAELAALEEQEEAERAEMAALAQQQEVERAAMAALADQEEVDERAARAALSDRWKEEERAREAALSIQEGGECAESAALPDGGVERASVAALPHHPEKSKAEGQE